MPGGVTLFRGDVVLARPAAQAQLFDEIQIDLDHTHGTFLPLPEWGISLPNGEASRNIAGRAATASKKVPAAGQGPPACTTGIARTACRRRARCRRTPRGADPRVIVTAGRTLDRPRALDCARRL